MNDTTDITEKKQRGRIENLKPFKKGESGNPGGRPKGSLSITALVKAELMKCPEGEDKKTYADLVVKRILSKAIKDGDDKMIDRIWKYIDGMPKESIDITMIDPDKAIEDLEKQFE